jgi:transmembrane sensor
MTDRQHQPDWEELAAYFAGEASRDEVAAIEAWAGASDERGRWLEELRQTWIESGSLPRMRGFIDTAAAWGRMRARIGAQHETPETKPRLLPVVPARAIRGLHRSSPRSWWGAAAAAAVLIVGSGVVMWKQNHPTPTAHSSPPVAMREYVAARGQRASIRLADGTRVVLAPDSRLRVPENIANAPEPGRALTVREVGLQGTAFFSVVHDEKRPFIVRTAAGLAHDLGTEFQVRAYEEMHGMEVTVVSGLVSLTRVTNNTSLARLQKGDRATLSNSGKIKVTHSVDLSAATALTEGKLVFDGTPLREVAIALSRWYDLDVRLGDNSIATRHLALTLEDEPPEVVLNMIALSLDLRVERNDQTVRLYPRSSRQNR